MIEKYATDFYLRIYYLIDRPVIIYTENHMAKLPKKNTPNTKDNKY